MIAPKIRAPKALTERQIASSGCPLDAATWEM
jgi:hypothetical protein